jgi:hypothetical protein
MGANVYLTHAASFGDAGEGATSVIIKEIPGRPGERISIRAFALYGAATAVDFYFMQVIGSDATIAAAASGGSIINLTAQPISTNELAAGDFLVIVQDNGVYHFSELGAVTGFSVLVLCTVLTGAVAIGNTVYDMGVYSDSGHHRIEMSDSTETERSLDGGLIYGAAKGYPMMLYNLAASSDAGVVRYLTVDYINK